MKPANWCAAFVMVLGLQTPCRAGGAGAEPFDFLFLDANARAVGMGGAYTALASDSNALLYNPAGLGRISRHEATFMHNQYFQGINQEYAAYASPQGWGASFNFLDFGDTQRTTYLNKDGDGMGSVGMSDLALAAGYGRQAVKGVHLGAGLKLLRESVAGYNAIGIALDGGILCDIRPLPGLRLGLAFQNLGPTVKFESARENLPLNLRLGGAYGFSVFGHESTLALDSAKERSQSPVLGAGFETALTKMLLLRAGYSGRNDSGVGVTMGLGWIWKAFSVDYAFAPYGDLGSAHRISMTWTWDTRSLALVPRPWSRATPSFEPTPPSPTPQAMEDHPRSGQKPTPPEKSWSPFDD